MTKKNIRPQQAAPVQRETGAVNFLTEVKLTAHLYGAKKLPNSFNYPFADDDAE